MARFRLIDDRFREDPPHYVLQAPLASVVIAVVVFAIPRQDGETA